MAEAKSRNIGGTHEGGESKSPDVCLGEYVDEGYPDEVSMNERHEVRLVGNEGNGKAISARRRNVVSTATPNSPERAHPRNLSELMSVTSIST